MSKRKKLILAFVIVNFLVITAIALWYIIMGITTEYVPPEKPGFLALNPKPLMLFFGGVFAILALIEGVLGILTYRGKKWAAIAMIVCEGFSWIGIFGTVAAIIELATPHENMREQS